MDITSILDAIELIVNQKINEATFTRFINGTIIDVINSEKNIYSVTTDGGKTSFRAQAVAAAPAETNLYQKDDEGKTTRTTLEVDFVCNRGYNSV